MTTVTTYTAARANLKRLLDQAVSSREPVIIREPVTGISKPEPLKYLVAGAVSLLNVLPM